MLLKMCSIEDKLIMVFIKEASMKIALQRPNFSKWIERITWQDLLGIVIGSLIAAAGIQCILVPANLLTGGVTGLAILLRYSTGIEVGIWILLLNIPIFLAGYRFISSRFTIYSLLGVLALAGFLYVFKYFPFLIGDPLLSALLGGVLSGLGLGIIFRSKASSGGTDIIAIIVKRLWGFNIGQTSLVLNIFVVGLLALVIDISVAMYSAIAIFVSSQVIDQVEAGLGVTETTLIISPHYEEIAYAILHHLHRGCTYLPAQGAYSGQNEMLILVTVGRMQLPRLKEMVFAIDESAFMIITNSIEVYGRGFKARSEY
jgi:uncharacterized membrane-anchored protein YitT (DUF2179 family)